MNGARSPSATALPWLVWSAAAALYGFGQIVRHSPSAMIDPLMRDLAIDATSFGLIASIFWYAYAALQLPGGFLLDRYGPGRVMCGGALIAGLGSLIFALAPDDSVALIARFMMGAGFATSYVGCLKSASQWFARHRYSTLVGFSVLAGMLGAIIGQAPMAALVGVIGWRTVAFGFAALSLPIAFILLLSGRARPPDAETPPRLKELFAMLGEAARSRQVWLAGLNNLGTTAPVVAFSLWGVAYYMQVFGLSRPEAATYGSAILVGWAIGSPIIGYISAHMRRRRPVTLICSTAGVMLWLLIVFVMPDLPRATHYALLFALGFASGLVSVTFSLAAEHGPPRAPGVSSAMVNTLVMGGAALSQGIVGVVLDAQWDGTMRAGIRLYDEDAFDMAFLLLPAMAGGGLLAACFVRETYCRLKGEAAPHAALADSEAP